MGLPPPVCHTATSGFFFIDGERKYFTMMTFSEYVQIKEGLWLNDKNALPGLSRLNPLPMQPKKKNPIAELPKPIRSVPKPIPRFGLFQRPF